jgi:hypothetical protein
MLAARRSRDGNGIIVEGDEEYHVNIPYEQLNQLVNEHQDKQLYWMPVHCTPETWDQFRLLISDSSGVPKWVQNQMQLEYDKLAKLPCRIYGGLYGGVYLSHPLDVTVKNGELYHLFCSGDLLCKVWADPSSGRVRCDEATNPGHFIRATQQVDSEGTPLRGAPDL